MKFTLEYSVQFRHSPKGRWLWGAVTYTDRQAAREELARMVQQARDLKSADPNTPCAQYWRLARRVVSQWRDA